MNNSILLLGGNKLHRGFHDWKQRNNVDRIYVFDWNENPGYTGDRHFKEDIKDAEAILTIIRENDFGNIKFCYTSADIAVPTQIKIHEFLGLNHPAIDTVNTAACKGMSTACWKRDGILHRYSEVFSEWEDVTIPERIRSIIVKPNMASGSRAITIIREIKGKQTQMELAFKTAKEQSFDAKVIIEEFVCGTEYTVEMLGDDSGSVAVLGISKKYYTRYVSDNRIATKLHYNPADVCIEKLKKIGEFGQRCYRSVGLKNSLGHLELIVKEDGVITPIEIGARSSGFIATHCLDAINCESALKQYENVLHGHKVENGLIYDQERSSMYFFYDICPGIARKTCHLMQFMPDGISSVQNDREQLYEGNQFQTLSEDAQRVGHEILVGSRDELTIDTIEKAEASFMKEFMGEKI